MIKIYGIKNCDTIKKTLKWFEAHNVEYQFIDYKKEPPTEALAATFLNAHPWDVVINKRGTTWRKLDDATKSQMDSTLAIETIVQAPSIIKRPIIENNGNIWIGYDETVFKELI